MDAIFAIISALSFFKILTAILVFALIILAIWAIFSITKSLKEISTKLGKLNAILAAQNKQQDIDPEENQS